MRTFYTLRGRNYRPRNDIHMYLFLHRRTQTVVGANPWVVHRDTEVYGAEADFRPDRWLKKDTGDMSIFWSRHCEY
jgi:hypothetical protein